MTIGSGLGILGIWAFPIVCIFMDVADELGSLMIYGFCIFMTVIIIRK